MATDKNSVCETFCTHPDKIKMAKENMIPDDDNQKLAETFKVFGDFNRLKILQALSCGELCVCDLAQILNVSQSAMSHQLRVLRTANLVRYRKDGKNAFYSLNDDHVKILLTAGLEHIREDHKRQEN